MVCSAVFCEKLISYQQIIIRENKECVFSVVLIVYLFIIVHIHVPDESPAKWTGRKKTAWTDQYKKCNQHGNSQLQDRVSSMKGLMSN